MDNTDTYIRWAWHSISWLDHCSSTAHVDVATKSMSILSRWVAMVMYVCLYVFVCMCQGCGLESDDLDSSHEFNDFRLDLTNHKRLVTQLFH